MLYLTLFFGCFVSFSYGSSWSYDDPSKWKDDYENCGGKKQSPINIKNYETTCNESLADLLSFSNFDKVKANTTFTVSNNGHSCVIMVDSAGATTTIKDGDVYKLAQFHLHWGSTDSKGSEHLMDGQAFPAELHLVHHNSKYATVSEAKTKEDGLAVIGVFFKVGKENSGLKNFLGLNITEEGSQQTFAAFVLNEVLPENKKQFYHYPGSLTVPTCDQTVSWFVMRNKLEMSQAQLDKFRQLKSQKGKPIVDNYRPTQALNDRKILASFKDACDSNSAVTITSFSTLFFLTFLLKFLF